MESSRYYHFQNGPVRQRSDRCGLKTQMMLSYYLLKQASLEKFRITLKRQFEHILLPENFGDKSWGLFNEGIPS